MSKNCDNCKSVFNEKEHIPISLKCNHIICLECHKNIKNKLKEDYCPICKKKNKIKYDSTKFINIPNNNALTSNKNTLKKFKFMTLDKNRRLSHAIHFNDKSRERLNNNKISNTLPKTQKFRKMTIDSTSQVIHEFKKRRKFSYNINNNIINSNKILSGVNPIINNNLNNNEKNNIESKKSLLFQSFHKSMSHNNQEESSELESFHYNKALNNISINKDNNNEIKKENKNNLIKEDIPEPCSIHIGKDIEFYCNNCSSLACSICLIDFHNGHNFGLLGDAIDKIRLNISDADNILNELLYQNNNNQKLLNMILNEINEYKSGQNLIVVKNFDEIIKKINQVKQSIIEEFDNKYNLELRRFEKFQSSLDEDVNEIKKTKMIINEIFKKLDISSEVKTLKEKNNYDNFLYWCNLNIKRLYKNQKNFKNDMFIDSSLKLIPININELMKLLNSINPKNIVYPFLNNNINITNDINASQNKINKNRNISNIIKTSNSYSYNNQAHYNNYNSKNDIEENNIFKKTNSDDIVLQNKIQRKYYEEYNNQENNKYYYNENYKNFHYNSDNLQNININKNYYKNGSIQYNQNQNNKNIIFQNANNNEIILNNNNQRPISQSSISFKNSQIINYNSKDEIENFYKIMKINNEIAVYCFTNLNCCLIYHIPTQNWKYIPYQNELSQRISYQKYSSVCLIPEEKMIITGGYNTISKEITNIVFQINIYDVNDIKLLQSMKIQRYSHSCIYLSNYVYCIGGYGYNNDKSNQSSSIVVSLKSCERYNIKTKEWKIIKELNSARACFGSCIYNNNIFVFGGYDNKNILSSIEKYEPITNIWITYHIKLPIKIAELGVINFNNKYIFLLGGIDENKNLLDNVYIGRLDHNFVKYSWREGAKLICPRNTRNNCFYLNNFIYVFGGSSEGICERYNFIKQEWEMIKSYLTIINDLGYEHKIKYLSSELSFNYSLT